MTDSDNLTQDDVQERLVAHRLGRRTGNTFVAEHCMLGKNDNGFVIYPKSDDPDTAQRVKTALDQAFQDAPNVTVEAPVGEARPAMRH